MGIVLILAVALAAPSLSEVGERMDDSAITARIESRFAVNEALHPINIKTSTREGVVTLSGSVREEAEKRLAEEVARGVPGVKEVKNEIMVVPVAYSEADTRGVGQRMRDWKTKTNLRGVLVRSGEFKGLRVDIKVVRGVATLSGVVRSEEQKARLIKEANEARGVTQVIDNLTVNSKESVENVQGLGGHFGDEWVEKRVERAILTNQHVSGREIGVEVNDGVCMLTGAVDSEQEKALAEKLARETKGISDVVNDIHVRPDGISLDAPPIEESPASPAAPSGDASVTVEELPNDDAGASGGVVLQGADPTDEKL